MFRLIWFHKKYWGVVICQCANRNFKLMEQWRRMSLTDWRRKANLKKTHFTTRNNGRTPILKKGKIQHVIALYSFSYWAAFKRLFVYYQLANTTNQYNLTSKVLHVGINILSYFWPQPELLFSIKTVHILTLFTCLRWSVQQIIKDLMRLCIPAQVSYPIHNKVTE